jgi:hypothetical protein
MFLERGSGNLDMRTAHSIMANSGTGGPGSYRPNESAG